MASAWVGGGAYTQDVIIRIKAIAEVKKAINDVQKSLNKLQQRRYALNRQLAAVREKYGVRTLKQEEALHWKQRESINGIRKNISAVSDQIAKRRMLASHYRNVQASVKNEVDSIQNSTRATDAARVSKEGFWATLMKSREQWAADTKLGLKSHKTLGRYASTVRMATHGLRGFRMEFLSVMFFGMQLQRTMERLLTPSFKLIGFFDLFNTTLEMTFLPTALSVQDALMPIMFMFISMPDWLKGVIGGFALTGYTMGGLMFTVGQFGLALGGILLMFPGLAKWLVRVPILGRVIRSVFLRAAKAFDFFTSASTSKKLTKFFGKGMKGSVAMSRGVSFSFTGLKTALKSIFAAIKTGFVSMLSKMKTVFTGFVSFLSANPIIIILMAIVAAILILNYMWAHNIFGIRQVTGNFVKFLAFVYNYGIKPTLSAIGTGFIWIYNIIAFAISHASLIWKLMWLNMYIVGATIWNAILIGIQTFVNMSIQPIQMLYDSIAAIAGFFGIKLPKLKFGLDLSKMMINLSGAQEEAEETSEQLGVGFVSAIENAQRQTEWWNNTLDGITVAMDNFGDELIRQGNEIDNGAKGVGFLDDVMSTLTGTLMGAQTNTTDFNSALSAVDRKMETFTGTVDNTKQAITTATDKWNDFSDGAHTNIEKSIGYVDNLKTEMDTKLTGVWVSQHRIEEYVVKVSKPSPLPPEAYYTNEMCIAPHETYTPPSEYTKGRGGLSEETWESYLAASWPEAFKDVIWRPGSRPIRISPSDTVFATSRSTGKVINFNPTINVEINATSEVDIDAITDKISSEWVEKLNSLVRR